MANNQLSTNSRSNSTDSQTLPSPSFTKPTQEPRSTSRHSKRLTLNFPILPPNGSDTRRTASPIVSTPAESPQASPDLKQIGPSPADPSGFLTSLAAQERKVLELRDELHRAETELTTLKRQWAQYEAHKKRNEMNHAEKLQPLHNPTRDSTQSSMSETEMKSTRKPEGRRTHQRVFSGSKHTRALSLLSPTSLNGPGTPPVDEVLGPSSTDSGQNSDVSSARITEVPTIEPEIAAPITRLPKPSSRRSVPPPSRDALVRTSKQMASDLKDGLWTFLEDIRQATVGEEGINATQSRAILPAKTPLTTSIASNSRLKQDNSRPTREALETKSSQAVKSSTVKDSSYSFWREFEVETPGQRGANPGGNPRKTTNGKHVEQSILDEDDEWDNWDTPLVQRVVQPKESRKLDNAPTDSSQAIPWPELNKVTPSKLTKTVSDMLKDWDISSPKPEPT